jgi:hypothetical protein
LEKNRRTVMSGGRKVEILRSKRRGVQDDMAAVMVRDGFRGALRWAGGRPWKAVPYIGDSLTLHEAVSHRTFKADMKVSATLKRNAGDSLLRRACARVMQLQSGGGVKRLRRRRTGKGRDTG